MNKDIKILIHIIIGITIRFGINHIIPSYFIPNRVELNTTPFALLDKTNNTLLNNIFSIIPEELLLPITIILSCLPAYFLNKISFTSAIILLYNPVSIVTSLSVSSCSLVILLQSIVLLIPKYPKLCSPFLPILVLLHPQSLPLLFPLIKSLSFTTIFTIPLFYFFQFPTSMFVSDLTPNLGLYWYLFTYMFEEYSLMYKVILPLVPYFIGIVLFIKMKNHTFYYSYCMLIIIGIMNCYFSMQDLVLPMALFNIPWFKLSNYFKKGKPLAAAFMLFPVFFTLFLQNYKYANFNSNMAYAMNLAIGFVLFAINDEVIASCLHIDYLLKHKVIENEIIDDVYDNYENCYQITPEELNQ